MADPRQRAWIEVNPSAIESNARTLIGLIGENCLLMAVVKADGYGHGAETVARAALKGGAHTLGVATLLEGIELRQKGFVCPILILGNLIDLEELRECLYWDLMPTISSKREASLCQQLAKECDRKFKLQLKLDTGMTRLGCDLLEAENLITELKEFKDIVLVGIYSHLALADGGFEGLSATVTQKQQKRFEKVLKTCLPNRENYCFHLANSAGTLRDSNLHYDMVRVGLALYGCSPFTHLTREFSLEPALAVKARVTFLREVPAGVGVSYGHSFVTKRPTRLAVIGIGYADGVSRALSGKISVLYMNNFLPQVGSITMDQMVIDVTDQVDIGLGSVVTLLGADKNKSISPKSWSDLAGTIPWEILCSFKNRLPRVLV